MEGIDPAEGNMQQPLQYVAMTHDDSCQSVRKTVFRLNLSA